MAANVILKGSPGVAAPLRRGQRSGRRRRRWRRWRRGFCGAIRDCWRVAEALIQQRCWPCAPLRAGLSAWRPPAFSQRSQSRSGVICKSSSAPPPQAIGPKCCTPGLHFCACALVAGPGTVHSAPAAPREKSGTQTQRRGRGQLRAPPLPTRQRRPALRQPGPRWPTPLRLQGRWPVLPPRPQGRPAQRRTCRITMPCCPSWCARCIALRRRCISCRRHFLCSWPALQPVGRLRSQGPASHAPPRLPAGGVWRQRLCGQPRVPTGPGHGLRGCEHQPLGAAAQPARGLAGPSGVGAGEAGAFVVCGCWVKSAPGLVVGPRGVCLWACACPCLR